MKQQAFNPYFTQSGKGRAKHPEQYIANMKQGAVAWFKYFAMGYADRIRITVRGVTEGKMQVSDNCGFTNICAEIKIRSKDNQ